MKFYCVTWIGLTAKDNTELGYYEKIRDEKSAFEIIDKIYSYANKKRPPSLLTDSPISRKSIRYAGVNMELAKKSVEDFFAIEDIGFTSGRPVIFEYIKDNNRYSIHSLHVPCKLYKEQNSEERLFFSKDYTESNQFEVPEINLA